jgi:hypothetical protein
VTSCSLPLGRFRPLPFSPPSLLRGRQRWKPCKRKSEIVSAGRPGSGVIDCALTAAAAVQGAAADRLLTALIIDTGLALWGGLIYIAAHFIIKYW